MIKAFTIGLIMGAVLGLLFGVLVMAVLMAGRAENPSEPSENATDFEKKSIDV